MTMNQQISNPVCACGNTFARTKSIATYGHRRTYFICRKCGARLVIRSDMDGSEICRYEPREARSHGPTRDKLKTLCWKCGNAYGNGCSWFRNYTPVPGWTAIEQKFIQDVSYTVIECPEFVEDRRKA